MINTSFNVRSEPIVCTPLDAYRCFMMTDMDALAIGRHVLLKVEQRAHVDATARRAHLAQFQLD
jgi:carbamoyltransferase